MTTPEAETIRELTTLISELTDNLLHISIMCKEALSKTNQGLARVSEALKPEKDKEV